MATRTRSRKPLPAGCSVLLGILLLIAGLAVIWFIGLSAAGRVKEVLSWERVPCVVKRAEVTVNLTSTKPALGTDVAYEFTHGGRTLSATKVFDGDLPGHVNELEKVMHGFRVQPQTQCLVNPQNPQESVLVPPTYENSLLFFGIGGVLVLFGLTLIALRLLRRHGRSSGALVGPLLSLIFVATGGACVWLAAKDDWKASAKRMKEAPCTILRSQVEEDRRMSKGRTKVTYRPDIFFSYEWEGRTWHSAWTDFSKNSYKTASRTGPDETVRRYPVGTLQKCWVDPEKPWVAVLEKSAPGKWLLWLVGGIFGLLGSLGLLYYLAKLALLIVSPFREKMDGPPSLLS